MDDPRTPLPTLSGAWAQGNAGPASQRGKRRARALVPVCLACRLRAEGVVVSQREQERLIDLEMARRVTVWLRKKGIAWP